MASVLARVALLALLVHAAGCDQEHDGDTPLAASGRLRLASALTETAAASAAAAKMAVLCGEAGDAQSLFAVVGSACPAGSTARRVAGTNIFDTLWTANPAMGIGQLNTSLAILASAARQELTMFRFFAHLYQDGMMAWVSNETQYWALFDQLWDAFDAHRLHAIPSIGYGKGWPILANKIHPGLNETMNDLVHNRSSISRGIQGRYLAQLVGRYSKRASLLMYELGNELNLMVDLEPGWCEPARYCFNTSAMVAYTADLAASIRRLDASRPISSGFSIPRNSAWHQAHCKTDRSGPCATGYWGRDTKAQFQEMLAAQQAGLEVWSIHTYQLASPHDCYFTPDCDNTTAILAAVEAATAAGAILYVGEYGGHNPNFTGPTPAEQAFPEAVLSLQVDDARQGGPLLMSTIWAYACPTHERDMVCIWPNSTKPREAGSRRMVSLLQQANRALQAVPASPGSEGGA